jgi:hypothetical protein
VINEEMEYEELTEQEMRIQIEKWKDEYINIYMMDIDGIPFTFRTLSRIDYTKSLEYYDNDYDRAEYVCRIAVLDPIDIDYSDSIYAGVPEVLARQILEESGFLDGQNKVKELMFKYDQQMATFDSQLSCIIAHVFPQYKIEEIDRWPLEKTISYYCKAKWVLAELKGIELTTEE